MKILHLALQAPYNEGWGYQENLLTKYQVRLGHDVTLVTTCTMNSTDSKIISCEPEDYISPDGFRVIRLKYKRILTKRISSLLQIFPIFDLIKDIAPDFIMVHGLGNFSALQVKKYIRKINPNCTVIADNHLDYNNCPVLKKNTLKSKFLIMLWQQLNKTMKNCYSMIYGVSPKRAAIINEIFKYPKEKIGILSAGADDDKIKFNEKEKIRRIIREKNNIDQDDFLIVTGGKIDEKKNIDLLMKAVSIINNSKIKLLVFGGCDDSIRPKIETLSKHSSIRYIGWINADVVYDYFLASDLIFFPGLHSVMWEQACASKIPCVFYRLDGFYHLDNDGSCDWIDKVTISEIINKIEELFFTEKYVKLKNTANSEKTDLFLYSNIAKKSLECIKENNYVVI